MARRFCCASMAFFSLSILATAGCESGSQPKMYPVAGTVSVDGQPLAEGIVNFKTTETGALETLNVRDGKFEGKAKEGERRVEIYSFRTKTQDIGGMKAEVKENLIPAQYNLESKLTAKVTPAGPNQFKFEVSKN